MAKQYYALEVRTVVAGFPMANAFTLFIDDPSVANEFLVAQSIINELSVGAGPTAWLFRFRALMSEQVYISNILCRRMSNGGGNTAEVILQTDTLPGLAPDVPVATQAAAVAIWTNTEQPNHTGRTFVPGISKDDLQDGRFIGTFQSRFDDFIARHVAGLNVSAGIAFFCTFDREFNVGYQIIDGYLSPKVGTMRKRERPL